MKPCALSLCLLAFAGCSLPDGGDPATRKTYYFETYAPADPPIENAFRDEAVTRAALARRETRDQD